MVVIKNGHIFLKKKIDRNQMFFWRLMLWSIMERRPISADFRQRLHAPARSKYDHHLHATGGPSWDRRSPSVHGRGFILRSVCEWVVLGSWMTLPTNIYGMDPEACWGRCGLNRLGLIDEAHHETYSVRAIMLMEIASVLWVPKIRDRVSRKDTARKGKLNGFTIWAAFTAPPSPPRDLSI